MSLASMLRIPVTLHNLKDEELFQPHSFGMFGTRDTESAGRTACSIYGPLY